MVGVPGRSLACKQCKEKRVACDLQQPQCVRCVKAKRSCQYIKRHIFVLVDEGSHKTKYRKECAILDSSLTCYVNEAKTAASSDCPLEPSSLFPFYGVPSPNKVLQQALLASGISYGESTGSTAYFGIISSSLAHSADTALFSPALACYALWRGRQDANSSMIDAGQQLYIRGLASTQKALADPNTALNDTTLAACHALGLYEALACPGNSTTAYMWHRAACCRLVRLRGPHAHREGLAHALFVSVRIFGVLEAVERGQLTYLTDEEWMSIPWESQHRTVFDKVIDICTLSPSIVAKAHSFKCIAPDQMVPWMVTIVSDIAALIDKFDAFYSEFVESNQGLQLFWEYTVPPSGYVLDDDEIGSSALTFAPTLCFPDLDTASILFMYWSSQASLWTGLHDISNLALELSATEAFYSTIRSHLGNDAQLSHEAMQAKWLDMTRKVCGSVAYCTTPSALESGPPRIATSLNMLIETMKNRTVCEREFAWAMKARQEIARRWIKLMGCL